MPANIQIAALFIQKCIIISVLTSHEPVIQYQFSIPIPSIHSLAPTHRCIFTYKCIVGRLLLNECSENCCWMLRFGLLLFFSVCSSWFCLCFFSLANLVSAASSLSLESRSNVGRKADLVGWRNGWGKAWPAKYLGDFFDWLTGIFG